MNTRTFGSIPKARFVAIAMVLALLMASAYGFAGANTFAASSAGSSAQTISGYTVGAITYTQSGTNAEVLDKVSFTLTAGTNGAPAKTAQAKVSSATTTYTACAQAGTAPTVSDPWVCDVTDIPVADADKLSVIAKSNT